MLPNTSSLRPLILLLFRYKVPPRSGHDPARCRNSSASKENSQTPDLPANEQGRCPSALVRCSAVFWGSGWGGGSLKAPTQRSERSTRLPQAQRLFTTYKRIVPNPNTATPVIALHGARVRGLEASGAATALSEQPLVLPWRRSSIRPRDMAVEWLPGNNFQHLRLSESACMHPCLG